MLSAMELHPDSRHFRWAEPVGPFELVSEAQARAYSEVGGFVLEGAITPDEISRVVAAIDPLEAEAEAALAAAGGQTPGIARAGEIVFSPHLVARSEVLKSFSRHPVFVPPTRELIGPDVRLY